MTRALILGVTGQDGSYSADLLLEKGYTVYGTYRRSSVDNLWRVNPKVNLLQADLLDPVSIRNAIFDAEPDEIYNEADQDNVPYSYSVPAYTIQTTTTAVCNLLETVRQLTGRPLRLFQPISATIFGNAPDPQNEWSMHNPLSPYAVAKVAALHLCQMYRQTYNVWVATGIMYNHDSVRRGKGYLLQEIAEQAIRVKQGEQTTILVGNPDLKVDIGHAPEFVEAAWQILQLEQPDDFILGSGSAQSIRYIAALALAHLGVPNPESRIGIDPTYNRPAPDTVLTGNIEKARRTFGFSPRFTAATTVIHLINHKLEQLQ